MARVRRRARDASQGSGTISPCSPTEAMMTWYLGVAYFFGGAFVANAVPHLIVGVSGGALQSPFASPPFRGTVAADCERGLGLVQPCCCVPVLLHVGARSSRSR